MPTQTRSPTIITTIPSGGTLAWSNPGNVAADDDNPATVHSSGSGIIISHLLLLTGFGFSTSGNITDFNLYVKRKINVAVSGMTVFSDNSLIEVGIVTQTLGAVGDWTTSYFTENNPFVKPTGQTAAGCNLVNYGIAIRIQYNNGDDLTDVIASIDRVYVTLDFDGAGIDPAGNAFSVGHASFTPGSISGVSFSPGSVKGRAF